MRRSTTDPNPRGRFATSWRAALATLLATSLVFPMGCAATDDYVEVQSPSSAATVVAERALPPTITAALQACTKEERPLQLPRHSYEVSFEVQTTDEGVIQEIKVKGDGLDDADLEACMVEALKTTPVHDYLRAKESLESPPVRVSSSSRALLGTAALLPQAIRLAPIVISAPGGITIVVAVAIVVVAAVVVEKLSKECQKQWADARRICAEWLSSPGGKHGLTGGYTDIENCARGRVDERCKGNEVDWGKQGRPGRRY